MGEQVEATDTGGNSRPFPFISFTQCCLALIDSLHLIRSWVRYILEDLELPTFISTPYAMGLSLFTLYHNSFMDRDPFSSCDLPQFHWPLKTREDWIRFKKYFQVSRAWLNCFFSRKSSKAALSGQFDIGIVHYFASVFLLFLRISTFWSYSCECVWLRFLCN